MWPAAKPPEETIPEHLGELVTRGFKPSGEGVWRSPLGVIVRMRRQGKETFINQLQSMDSRVLQAQAQTRFSLLLIGVFSTIAALLAVSLWYLRDPAWIAGQTTGMGDWQQDADGIRYRWANSHASFFVPSDATAAKAHFGIRKSRRGLIRIAGAMSRRRRAAWNAQNAPAHKPAATNRRNPRSGSSESMASSTSSTRCSW